VHVRTGALLLIGIGSALVIVTLLLVFILPSGRRRRLPDSTPRRFDNAWLQDSLRFTSGLADQGV
jgi:hypothetical protein